VTVAVNQTFFHRLEKKLLSGKVSNHEMQELVQLITSIPENHSFVTKKGAMFLPSLDSYV